MTGVSHCNYHYGMTTTIDKAGRIVLPKSVRDRLNLRDGTVLEIEVGEDEVRLHAVAQRPALIEKQGVLVHHGSETVSLDVADFINREREVHALRVAESGERL